MDPTELSSPEQPSQAPQDSDDLKPPEQQSRRRKGFSKQPMLSWTAQHSVGVGQQAASPMQGQGITASNGLSSLSSAAASRGAASDGRTAASPGFLGPASDGRTVVVSGLRKDLAGPEAKQKTVEFCKQYGEVSCCWLRKGKSSYWFAIVQFAEVSHSVAHCTHHALWHKRHKCQAHTSAFACRSCHDSVSCTSLTGSKTA